MKTQSNKKHLDCWVLFGGIALAGIAGFVNVSMLGFFHVPVSHMSGAISYLSIDVVAGREDDLKLVASIVLAFAIGAVISGTIIGNQSIGPGRKYGIVLMIEGVLLACSAWLAAHGWQAAVPMASLCCGMQNAMASSYHGLIIRTTHMTGIVTDLGVQIGHLLRRHHVNFRNILLLLGLLIGFFVGGCLGYIAYNHAGERAIGFAAPVTFLGGLGYFIRRHMCQNQRTSR